MVRWYVLQVSTGQETAVREALEGLGVRAAVPHVLRCLGPNGLAPSYLPHLEVEWLRLLDNGGELLKPSRVEELPGGGVRIVEGVLRNFPISSIDYDKRTRRAKVEISLCGEPKTLTLSVEGDGSEEAGSS